MHSRIKQHVDIHYLQMIAKIVKKYKELTYKYMNISAGDRVIDVGCGPATDTIPIASKVGFDGLVVGIDSNDEMISEANRISDKSNFASVITHLQANADLIPFKDNYFTSSRSERVFQHLDSPQNALREMVRVTQIGGNIVVLDTDWNSISIDTSDHVFEQKLREYRLKYFHKNGFAARQLYCMFNDLGLMDIGIEMCPIYLTDYTIAKQSAFLDEVERNALADGFINEADLESWHSSLIQHAFFFGSINQILVYGKKP
jgi:ubiquinone/menaquinone biosynthesis C-methylase UbiE